MKKFIIGLVLALGLVQGSLADELIVHTGSIHAQEQFYEKNSAVPQLINNLNLGLGYRTESGFTFGAYKNSYQKNTVYVSQEFMLNKYLGVVVGAATGYKHTSGWVVTPLVTSLVKIPLAEKVSANITASPSVGTTIGTVHFVLAFKI